jgi:hypothetical protein
VLAARRRNRLVLATSAEKGAEKELGGAEKGMADSFEAIENLSGFEGDQRGVGAF